jgi:hypothetical protein
MKIRKKNLKIIFAKPSRVFGATHNPLVYRGLQQVGVHGGGGVY